MLQSTYQEARELPAYETRSDVASQVLEFLNELRADDIITELVQNDLDQSATKTTVTITQDALVAEGNGRPVDAAGWQRLTYMLGAGVEVAAKRDGIGVKNHGLRACFSLGDTIVVRSDQLRTQLTLRKHGEGGVISPGAWTHPIKDEGAPSQGCRVEVSFRTVPLTVPGGEGVALPVPTDSVLETMFLETCAQAASRLLGCFRPGYRTHYALELHHWTLGTYTFGYSVTPLRDAGKLTLYRRRCVAATPSGKSSYSEDAFLYIPPEPLELGHRISSFFRHRKRVAVEVSWMVNIRGIPRPSSGHFRYPIGYTGDAANSRTSVGANISAPFVSETARHGMAEAARTNNERLVAAGELALMRVLREYLVPKYGPEALVILEDPLAPRSARSDRLVLAAARGGALPAASRPTGRTKSARARFRCVPSEIIGKRSFIVPALTWDHTQISALLSTLAPREYPQLHPDCSEQVVSALLHYVYDGSGSLLPYTSFDENDVIVRLQPTEVGYFPWSSLAAATEELGDPDRVRWYLDLIGLAQDHGLLSVTVAGLSEKGVLPDVAGKPTQWRTLYWARSAIEPIPGVASPPQVHTSIGGHRVLTRGSLKLRRFELDEYISRVNFTKTGDSTPEQFWGWLIRNANSLAGNTLKMIGSFPIWPTNSGEYVSFDALCYLAPDMATVLAGHVRLPAPDVHTIPGVRRDWRGVLRLRTIPTEVELRSWYTQIGGSFPRDALLDPDQRQAFLRFEADLQFLRDQDKSRRSLSWVDSTHPGLSRGGRLQPVSNLHLDTEHVTHCALVADDLIAQDADVPFYRYLGARTRPSAAAVVRALAADPKAEDSLYYRLAAYSAAVKDGEPPLPEIGRLPILRISDRAYPPEAVALHSAKDYWGHWKVRLEAERLTPDREAVLRMIGVTARVPSAETSRQFFEWLSSQDEATIAAHVEQAIRHFLLTAGPLSWWNECPTLRCLPVYAFGRHVQLVSRKSAFTPSQIVCLPDFEALESLILEGDPRRRIAIVESSRVSDSILERLREAGLPTLRQAVTPPASVHGIANGRPARELEGVLARLQSPRLVTELRKRLQEQHISNSYLKTQWHHELQQIFAIRFASKVSAEYVLGSRRYHIAVTEGIDQSTGILWVSSAVSDPVASVYRAVAERIFSSDAPGYCAFALRSAIENQFTSRFQPPANVDEQDTAEDDDAALGPADSGLPIEAKAPGDLKQAHPTPTDEPEYPPTPEPFTQEETRPTTSLRLSDAPSRRAIGKTSPARYIDPVEQSAVKKLKSRHYSWHCQKCLADTAPSVLAPTGSYAALRAHRREFIHAHHVDPVHAEGARAVGNIILLCAHHHRLLGDKLSRNMILLALQTQATVRVVHFPAPEGRASKDIEGLLVIISIDSDPWTAPLFFTGEHARVWLALGP